jgi:hypothetical protein
MEWWSLSIFNVAMETGMRHNGMVSRPDLRVLCIVMKRRTEIQSRLLCSIFLVLM